MNLLFGEVGVIICSLPVWSLLFLTFFAWASGPVRYTAIAAEGWIIHRVTTLGPGMHDLAIYQHCACE